MFTGWENKSENITSYLFNYKWYTILLLKTKPMICCEIMGHCEKEMDIILAHD